MAPSLILDVFERPMLLVILTTGIVLSSVSIWVYFRICREKHWKSSTDLLFLIHSSAQFLCSISSWFFQIFKLDCMHFLIDKSTIFKYFFLFYYYKGHLILQFTYDFAKFLTYSTTELIAILQCISVRDVFGARTSCSVERVRLFLIPLVLFSLVQASGHLMLQLAPEEKRAELESHWKFLFLNPIFLVLLISLTYGILIWSVRKAQSKRQHLIVHQKSQTKTRTSTMIIFIITSNIITNLGHCVAGPTLWKFFDDESQIAKHIFWFLGLFMTTEPICTFLSHFLFSSDYQKIVRGIFKFR